MKRKVHRVFGIGYGILLTAAFAAVLLDAFVIPRAQRTAEPLTLYSPLAQTAEETTDAAEKSIPAELSGTETETATEAETEPTTTEAPVQPTITDSSYQDGSLSVTIQTLRTLNTTYYAADIQLTDVTSLRTAFAENTYGRNIRQTTGDIAQSVDAILAVNGDYYGFRDSGTVLRNGTLYRASGGSNEVLLIDSTGDFSVFSAQEAATVDSIGWWQGFSFGPALVREGAVAVTPQQEVGQAKVSNPRTAIGQIDSLHYVFVVSDGRTEESEGLTLYELAGVMQALGCRTAYNLDGGGSSTMVFMGQVVNRPTSNGRRIVQREVSDIVYIGL